MFFFRGGSSRHTLARPCQGGSLHPDLKIRREAQGEDTLVIHWRGPKRPVGTNLHVRWHDGLYGRCEKGSGGGEKKEKG